MALITLINKLSNALDEGSNVVKIFLGFPKALDTIDHDILLLKLEYYGVRGPAINKLSEEQISVCNVQWDQIISISGNMWSSQRINSGASSIFDLCEWPTK